MQAAALAASPPQMPFNPWALNRDYFAGHIPENEQYRPTWGRTLDLDRIDRVIKLANSGIMSQFTDLSRETNSLDGHLCSLLQKRLNRVASLEWSVQETTGPGIDEGRAKEYAAFVREQLRCIPNFRAKLKDIAWGLFDGRACSEIEWRRESSLWIARDLHWIHPRRLSFGPDRDLRVVDPMRQTGQFRDDVGFPVEQVPFKFVVFRPRMFGDYQEREGLAYRCLYWSFFGRLGVREQLELMEIFGKPWRILIPRTGPGMPAVNADAVKIAFNALTLLGFHNTVQMPANCDVQIVQPEQGAGQVHAQVIVNAKEELSKLVLGNTSTTDNVATGLGSGLPGVHQSEQDLILLGDALDIAEVLEHKLTDAMCQVNFGFTPDVVSHCPRFQLRTEQRKDPDTEQKRINGALAVGLRVAEEQARDLLGIREVRVDEPYLIRTVRPTALGQAPAQPSNETVFPAGSAPSPGEVIPTPDAPINVDDGLEELPPGADPLTLPSPGDGSDELSTLDEDDLAALCRKMNELGVERCRHNNPNRCRICGIERIDDVELDATGAAQWKPEWKPIGASRVKAIVEAEVDDEPADPSVPAPSDGQPADDDEDADPPSQPGVIV